MSTLFLADEAQTLAAGACLARVWGRRGGVFFLLGELGAGKTTLVRGVLRAYGHAGAVKSPTYSLLESYRIGGFRLHHLDLYRLNDPEELAYLGFRDLLDGDALLLIEWPQRGEEALPVANLQMELEQRANGRVLRLSPAGADVARVAAALASCLRAHRHDGGEGMPLDYLANVTKKTQSGKG
ncbi:MAG TPA: tRNA (adenosine(37)-N6)-threonylcarbamoyltransferase complex ATPase subunit type 1 TsaE [Gammaproteobacteria bacterium]|nr:tRNA (adenosine(37)-N6)-threonylcarbamoyltransferase complex ATPase subunit type 1 TsaE [Gammaproteobacteria bacterium]